MAEPEIKDTAETGATEDDQMVVGGCRMYEKVQQHSYPL